MNWILQIGFYLAMILVVSILVYVMFNPRKTKNSIVGLFKIFIVLLLFIGPSFAQENVTDDFAITDERPLIFPKEMPAALDKLNSGVRDVVNYLAQDDTWRAGILDFLGDDENTTKILHNNTTIIKA